MGVGLKPDPYHLSTITAMPPTASSVPATILTPMRSSCRSTVRLNGRTSIGVESVISDGLAPSEDQVAAWLAERVGPDAPAL